MTEPTSPDDLDARLRVVEREVGRLREELALTTTADAAAARVLAAGADRDVSEVRAELRAHTQVLNALRETQLETLEAQAELQAAQAEMQAAQIEMQAAQAEMSTRMENGFATVNLGMAQITTLLTRALVGGMSRVRLPARGRARGWPGVP